MFDLKKWIAKVTDFCTCDLLFSGSATGDVTLSKSVANYKKLIVEYHDNDGAKFTKVINNNNVVNFSTYFEAVRPTTRVLYIKAYIGTFNGTTLIKAYNRQSAGGGTPAEGNYIYIDKIYGCKSIVGGGTA